MRENGGSAFPCNVVNCCDEHGQPDDIPGMFLRDWFAGMALHHVGDCDHWAGYADAPNYYNDIAASCYRMADAMLKAREVK